MNEISVSQTWLRRGLNIVGISVVGSETIREFIDMSIPLWVLIVVLAALGAWVMLSFAPRVIRLPGYLCGVVMVVGGGLAAASTNGVGIVPVIVALIWSTRSPEMPLGVATAFGLGGVVTIALGSLGSPMSVLGLLSLEAGILVAFMAGLSRRQFVRTEAQALELFEAAVAVREEQSRADVLTARQHIAHDIHDVLAHSLGGLVIQLDAVDALLEVGDTAAAVVRVRESRALAAEGLGEARRAVNALSVPPENPRALVSAEALLGSLSPLLGSHRSLGGEVVFRETGQRHDVNEPLGVALRRTLQEGLTNARKHAAGQAVSVRLGWTPDSVALIIENRLAKTKGSTAIGGGHGLVGMRERFAALPGGAASAEVESDRFVVRVEGRPSE